MATACGSRQVADLLIELKADVHATNVEGTSAVNYAMAIDRRRGQQMQDEYGVSQGTFTTASGRTRNIIFLIVNAAGYTHP